MSYFDKRKYSVEGLDLNGTKILFRAFRNLVYVDNPSNAAYQSMNIFVPEAFYHGQAINGYTLKTAPVFVPNTVGGYMPGPLDEPGFNKFKMGELNSIYRALEHGYVVAAPAIRGRCQFDENGLYTGKAPNCIVDYKAAIRYLHYFAEDLPGDDSKIITNGTSAGGCLSSLMGATGNHPDYDGYLSELGAAGAGDEIYAASCYCPIANMENAHTAYEWQFRGVHTYDSNFAGLRYIYGGRPDFESDKGTITGEQIRLSEELAAQFPAYINSLSLAGEQDAPLTLDTDGNGAFKDYIRRILAESAKAALGKGIDVFASPWVRNNGGGIEIDFDLWAKDIGRMKTPSAFDDIYAKGVENDLFGTAEGEVCHYTEYIKSISKTGAPLCDAERIKMMNPMEYVADGRAVKARFWRIRHGSRDRDTSLAISAILAGKLKEAGLSVDYHAPWGIPHAGDYDVSDLFQWIDSICRK
ncbi:MAG: alpha/beta hydrolase [Treponema sp.]|nr:alpha/beta hydrolase [Treponema sp.]